METLASPEEKFKIIQELISRDNNELNISWLCEIAEVSRSGYYRYINHGMNRVDREQQDQQDFELVLAAYGHRGKDKGARSIYMRLLHIGIVINLKKIRRLMKKFGLVCKIRQANPYRRMAKALKTNTVYPNLVDRNFIQGPRKILLTDITYLFYGKARHKAYLSVIIDAFTKQVLSYVLSSSLEIDFVEETVNQLLANHKISLTTQTLIHSDQGVHYTSIIFQELIKNAELRQSMSRRGNCWDNAPQESFFGHMKDELNLTGIESFSALKQLIDDHMDYYNNERYQWELAKLSPNQYYDYYLTGIHPLAHLIEVGTCQIKQEVNHHLNQSD